MTFETKLGLSAVPSLQWTHCLQYSISVKFATSYVKSMSLVVFFHYFQEFFKTGMPVRCYHLLRVLMIFLRPGNSLREYASMIVDPPPSPPYLLSPQERETCSATVKTERKRRILYQDCISVKTYRLRFCDTCRKRKCCFPRKTRQRRIEFQVRKRGGGLWQG